ncbi:hypothetical protein AVEN_144784-1 [Araneus ventricosus]|uniref:Uncharacterized protein n=1 Tax=Araneus ventricosus TaxID=182803 RepID=A0A4Y2LDF8_ARAVE|nr:hypothetical protein AVEN_144784-1 [Araneus ventricosus]
MIYSDPPHGQRVINQTSFLRNRISTKQAKRITYEMKNTCLICREANLLARSPHRKPQSSKRTKTEDQPLALSHQGPRSVKQKDVKSKRIKDLPCPTSWPKGHQPNHLPQKQNLDKTSQKNNL